MIQNIVFVLTMDSFRDRMEDRYAQMVELELQGSWAFGERLKHFFALQNLFIHLAISVSSGST